MDKVLKKAAEILVECGYAESTVYQNCVFRGDNILHVKLDGVVVQVVEPFEDSLYGRRQADAIEDWLESRHHGVVPRENGYHQWRLDRIKWCLEQLEKE